MTNPALRIVGFLAVLFLVVGAAVALGDDDDPRRAGLGRPRPEAVDLGEVRLVSAESCDELVAFYREAAALSMTNVGGAALGGVAGVAVEESAADMAASAGGSSAPATTATQGFDGAERDAMGGDDEFSGTNLQERDVDEPDTVKTNGDIAVLVAYDGLNIVDVGEGEPSLLAHVDLEQGGHEIILAGDRVLALTTVWREDPAAQQQSSSGVAAREIMIAPGKEVTILTSIDISDPENPEVVATSEHDGAYRTARATGEHARVVLVSYPQVYATEPAALESTTTDDWVPEGVECGAVSHPTEPQGTSTTTVLTVELSDASVVDTDAVVADPGTVYASADRLYVATSQWQAGWNTPDGEPRTELHAFDITDPTSTSYVGSGAIEGFLLNQFSLSEHEGDLRVATTMQPPWDPATNEQGASSSAVVVLDEVDGALTEIGRVGDLGVTEVIRSVRFMGDVAYVVTFRQTDPLYVIDLSDPTAPRTAGELKIPGYSAYLHPIGDDVMVGVGQDATDEGMVLGTQVSTFDVSDMTAPTRIDNVVIENGTSQVEWDHRAFLWWAQTRTAVIPLEVWDPDAGAVNCPPGADCAAPGQQGFIGAIAFDIDEDGDVREAGRVSHQGRGNPNAWAAVQRSFVVGDSLYTVSEIGVLKSALDGFDDEGFAALPTPQYDGQPVPLG